ncbi:Purine catabolism regulatory protein [Streptomyces sp. YIM 130001]|uniref:PucR family transcriptional regulator n=1 Tax=Streptomyces sp. YIM 130001 TaxID=2259644 RepID=UPI000E64C941|nr:helix-turn-helix domain-containing protein [Streptomyces sp. YIM 130001]RII20476.1 Purine catabolism regulatory protein [Streptomyces sp. YIM 130001]
MVSELQQLVDAFGARLGRSIAIDDARIRLLVHSAHTGDVDAARIESIMRREVSTALVEHVTAHGAAQAADVFTVPPRTEIGMAVERIGTPIRYDGALLGYVWLLGSDGPAGARESEALREAAGQAALIMHRDYLADEVSRSHARELLRDLVAPDDALRTQATASLVEDGHAVAGPVVALVATVAHAAGEPPTERQRLALDLAVDHTRRRLPPSRGLALTRPDHALLLTVWPGARSDSIDRDAGDLAGVLREKLAAELGVGKHTPCWVGVGSVRRRLSEAHASYREARRAAEVARITGVIGQVASYPRLGVYALLAKLSPEELAEGMHPGLRGLLSPDAGHQDLVETLRVYLDRAGDAQRAAAELHVHRSTLYHRLRRVEELAGLDLGNGDDRLVAHLGLKMARLRPAGTG